MKNKTVAGVMALVMGYLGLHRFYLGQIGWGIVYLAVIPSLMLSELWWIGIIGIIDAIVLLSMDDDDFDEKYNAKAIRKRERNEYRARQRSSNRDYDRNRRYEAEPKRKTKTTPTRKKRKASPATHMKAGKDKFADYDFEGAIAAYNKALEIDPQNVAAHFNLACAHSLMEHKDKAFYHLDRAVALGFNDFEIIKTRDHLAYIRVQPEFEGFASNGFRLSTQRAATKEKTEPQQLNPAPKDDLLAQLEKLASLKERGLLTEREFQMQKDKLMR